MNARFGSVNAARLTDRCASRPWDEYPLLAAIIELRDAVDEATKAFTRMGVKQRGKLQANLWPTA
jgi:hypothetical protein